MVFMESMRSQIQARQEAARQDPALHADMSRHPEGGAINIGFAITIAGVIVGAVVGLSVLSALAPTWFDSTSSLAENFSTADVGDTTANGIANDVFPLIIALLGVFAIAGLAFGVMKLRK